MKLRELIELMETGDEEHVPQIQISFSNCDWGHFDQLCIDSELLWPVQERDVDCIAVEGGILRVGVAGEKVCTPLHLYK